MKLSLLIAALALTACGAEQFPDGYVCRHDDLPAKVCSVGDELGVIYQGSCYVDPNPLCRPRLEPMGGQ